jgi:hypothetical protein
MANPYYKQASKQAKNKNKNKKKNSSLYVSMKFLVIGMPRLIFVLYKRARS